MSWHIRPYGGHAGIVPRFCDELFETINHRKAASSEVIFEVKCHMVEIYNEVVLDLLNPSLDHKKKGLRVREHPTTGFYGSSLGISLFTAGYC